MDSVLTILGVLRALDKSIKKGNSAEEAISELLGTIEHSIEVIDDARDKAKNRKMFEKKIAPPALTYAMVMNGNFKVKEPRHASR